MGSCGIQQQRYEKQNARSKRKENLYRSDKKIRQRKVYHKYDPLFYTVRYFREKKYTIIL